MTYTPSQKITYRCDITVTIQFLMFLSLLCLEYTGSLNSHPGKGLSSQSLPCHILIYIYFFLFIVRQQKYFNLTIGRIINLPVRTEWPTDLYSLSMNSDGEVAIPIFEDSAASRISRMRCTRFQIYLVKIQRC